MKYLLSGVVIAAAFSIAVPVWAQGSNAAPPAAYSGPSPRGEMSSERAAPSHHHARLHHRHAVSAQQGGQADQLNQQELTQLQAGGPGMPAPASQGTPTGRGFGPKASGGNYIPSQP